MQVARNLVYTTDIVESVEQAEHYTESDCRRSGKKGRFIFKAESCCRQSQTRKQVTLLESHALGEATLRTELDAVEVIL